MKHAGLFFFLALLISCETTHTIYDYDEQQDFSIYKTYAFYPEMNSELNDLDQKRLLMVTEAVMQSKGFTKSETLDIYMNFKAPSRNSIGVGVGSGSGGVSIGVGGSIPIGGSETFLELTIDFVDVKKDELVWQAIAERRFYPNASSDTRTNFFQKIIENSLVKYPPKHKE